MQQNVIFLKSDSARYTVVQLEQNKLFLDNIVKLLLT